MSSDLQQLLAENLAVSKESLLILKKMHRAATVRQVFGFIKWLIIIGLTVYGLLQLYPYMLQLQETVRELQNMPSVDSLNSSYFIE